MEIHFDSTIFDGWNITVSSFPLLSDICAGTANDLGAISVSGSVAHSSSSLTFKVVAKTNETTLFESFGLREVSLLFASNSILPTDTICGNTVITLSSQQCSCPDGQYKDSSNVCQPCHGYCALCFGSSDGECLKCKEGYSFDGTSCFPCPSHCASCNGPAHNQCTSCKSGYHLFKNNSCISTSSCAAPLIKTFYDTYCESPCTTATDYVYWNGVCSSSCNSPLQNNLLLLNTIKYCHYPCTTSEYLYWNETCSSTCPPPFKQTTSNDRQYCDTPCSDHSHFYYWNETCSAICEPLLATRTLDGVVKLCEFPCPNAGEYLYWNGSCKNGCLNPFKPNIVGDKHYCILPCDNNYYYLNGTCSATSCHFPYQQVILEEAIKTCVSVCNGSTPYLYWNDSCLGNCQSPLQSSSAFGLQMCNFPCTHGEYLYWNGSCSTSCNYPLHHRLEGGENFCDYPCAPTGEYLFWNDTCHTTCPTPLVPRTEASRLYCDLPCSNIANFLYWNGSCLSSCRSPLVPKVQHLVNVCEYSCSSSQYLHWNGPCQNNCPYPLKSRLESTKNFCDLPCDINDFLYWNGSCLRTCSFPLTNRVLYNVKLCEFPCSSTSQFLYWNGTCAESCQRYYTANYQGSRNFCFTKCPLTQSLYTNTSACMDTCPGGFFNNDVTKLCQGCEDQLCNYCPPTSDKKCLECKEFAILENEVCKKCEKLKVEFIKSTQKYHQYRLRLTPSSCDLDVTTVQIHFKGTQETQAIIPPHFFEIVKLNKNLYQANLVLKSSLYENKQVDVELFYLRSSIRIPKTLVADQSLEKLAQSGPAAKTTLLGMMGASLGGTLALGFAACLWSILSFQQFVGNFLYINVEYPYQVKLFLSLFQSISWNVLPNPLASLTSRWSKDILAMEDELKQYHPPKKFTDNDLTSFFIENAGSIFVTNLLLLIVLFFVLVLKKIPALRKNRVLTSMKVYLRWNIIIRTFLENGIPLSLAIFLQARVIKFDNAYIKACGLCAVISAIYVMIMIGFILRVLYSRDNSNLDKRVVRKQYGTLYEGISLDGAGGKYYHLLILFRGILVVFLVTFFEDWPLLQSGLLVYFNAGLIYFLFTKASFINKKLNIINRIKEILILVGEMCLVLLQFQLENKDYFDVVGWIMVAALASALLIELVYTMIIQILHLGKLFRKIMDLFKSILGRSRPKPNNRISFKDPVKHDHKLFPATKKPNRSIVNLNDELDIQVTNVP